MCGSTTILILMTKSRPGVERLERIPNDIRHNATVQFGFRWNCWIQNVNHSELPSTAHFITHQWWHRTLFNIMQNYKMILNRRDICGGNIRPLLLTFAESFGQMNSILVRCFSDHMHLPHSFVSKIKNADRFF